MSWVSSVLVTAALLVVSTSSCAPTDEASDPPASKASSPSTAASTPPSSAPSSGTDEPDRLTAGDHDLAVTLGGTERRVLLHAPEAVEGKGRIPLVLAFHGQPGSPEEMARVSGWDEVADEHGFLVAYPEYVVESADVLALVDHLVESWRVDPDRVHATGFSAGGASTYKLAVEASDRIASFAPVSSGPYYLPEEPIDPAPLLAVQGLEDSLADSFGQVNRDWAARADCEPPVEETLRWRVGPVRRTAAACAGGSEHVVYRAERMGHAWPREATELIWAFFERHPLSD